MDPTYYKQATPELKPTRSSSTKSSSDDDSDDGSGDLPGMQGGAGLPDMGMHLPSHHRGAQHQHLRKLQKTHRLV